jgi:hypothetical protein
MDSTEQAREQYEQPEIVDYGSLVELTANSATTDNEDGFGKIINTDGSTPMP